MASHPLFKRLHTFHKISPTGSYAYHTNSSSALLRNSLLIEVTYGANYAGPLTKIQTVETDNESAQFQTVGGGAHYLRLNSPWRGLGTTNLDATLRQDLASLTTYAPTLLTGTLTSNQTLLPVVPRDVASLGYHYPAIDYLAANLTLQNSALTLRGGVVVAGGPSPNTFSSIYLNPGKLLSVGAPVRMNRILRANQVQEALRAESTPSSTMVI